MPRKSQSKEKVTFTEEPFWIEANKVKLDPNNANTHSQRSIEAIAQSLLRFGFRKPMIADRIGVISDGEVRFEFKDGNSQVQLRSMADSDYDFRYVIMPMRI